MINNLLAAVVVLLVSSCSIKATEFDRCPPSWTEPVVKIEENVAREMVRRATDIDPGILGVTLSCDASALPSCVTGTTRDARMISAVVRPTECINRSAAMHEFMHRGFFLAVGDPDAGHVDPVWQFEQFERECGRVRTPGLEGL